MRRVEVVEVSPRDGLQSDGAILATEQKVALVTRALDAGIRRVEVASFVNPKRVPQMADAEAVLEALPRPDGVSYIGLVLNERGFERAARAPAPPDEINVVVVLTDTFARANQGMTTDELVATWERIAALARDAGMPTSVTLSASFGCPYEGEVPLRRVVDVATRVAAAGPDELALADSIGVAVPTEVTERFAAVRAAIDPGIRLRAHFHNTRNTGIANAAAAVLAGVPVLDASLGGIGGCPFAPRATGNIPTEDLVYLLDRMGYETGVDLARLTAAVPWIEEVLDHPVPGLLARAGLFPDTHRGE